MSSTVSRTSTASASAKPMRVRSRIAAVKRRTTWSGAVSRWWIALARPGCRSYMSQMRATACSR
ncbi:hypothetical protein BC477_01435 [Clavibacter michiganensis subsp. michiganensis]|uniref:Uncharacterized protein n=1 Tax=Clavibacter michiganensis subsp. michiganensis TaxID=33013 RepID=A0A1Y3FL53_CLAMM|nr:hypothetical protein BC477_01435 [Clavibacter michiganensis subsp. michiganensis]OUD94969.1 hypothetical protein CMMCAS04_04805 [Clavibacter michiganensis subsp. michiganensis]OUE03369.1 hypothetical protein CMMCAS07_00370 [Clavibacter michiganensis subsp. michiganensis]